jgi:hypothetical protein
MVEEGLMTPEHFREFVFTNNVTLHTALNPDFFKGTRIEKEVARVLSASR